MGYAQAVVGAGSPAKGPALLANFTSRSPSLPPPYSRVNPHLKVAAKTQEKRGMPSLACPVFIQLMRLRRP
ncbi:hypothetical protein PRJ_2416 [Pseudomonas sp. XWY-1]|nr:hypothetical protein PRJ_2416 [Pseudomonas sp. XWY-1]